MKDALDIQAGEALSLLQGLVRAPSVNPPGDTAAAVRVLAEALAPEGIAWRAHAAKPGLESFVARLPGRGPGKTLLLNGHIDVVPAGENWTTAPFGGDVREGRVYGRGTADMKGGIAAMALAVMAIKRAGTPFAGEVLFTAVADEETGGRYGTRFLLEQGIGREAAYAIVGEPTRLNLDLGNRGVTWFEIDIEGRAGHPGRPHGANPIHYAGRLINAIAGMQFDLRNDLFEVPVPSITVTMVEGGVKANVIPSACKLTVDRRLLPGENADLARVQVEKVIANMPQEGVRASVTVTQASEPYLIGPDSPIAQALVRAHGRVVGGTPALGAKGGGTDGSILYNVAGIPTALYGPGDPRLAHTADEYVEVDGIVKAARVYVATILDLLGEAE
ncbi:MAG: M20 family metallopeptidase [Chloroflexota bacterium]